MIKKILIAVFLSFIISQHVTAQEVGRINLICKGLLYCETGCADIKIDIPDFETKLDIILKNDSNNTSGVYLEFLDKPWWFQQFPITTITDKFLSAGSDDVGQIRISLNRETGFISFTKVKSKDGDSSVLQYAYLADCELFKKKDKLF